MEKAKRRQAILENLIYGIIWLVVLVLPVFMYSQSGTVYWSRIFSFWIRILPFFVLFVVNNYVLVPCFLTRKRWWLYFASLAVLLFLFFSVIQPSVVRRYLMPKDMEYAMMMHERMDADSTFMPPWLRGEMDRREMPPQGERGEHMGGRRPPERGMPPGGPVLKMPVRMSMMLNDWLVAILIVGFNIAIRYMFKSIRDERQIKELEATTLQAELNYLKAQINPHFFMNTLNNIHALVDIDGEKAKETVIELSKIMRYVLYEADQQGIQLSKEIQFIENYVSLMRIRFSDEIDIVMEFPDPVPDVKIPPMMLVTLIENAFKHGISYRRDSYIHTRLTVLDDRITYTVENSLGEKGSEKPGVGMENMRKRLNLLYGGRYTLDARQTLEKYTVTLTIPVMP